MRYVLITIISCLPFISQAQVTTDNINYNSLLFVADSVTSFNNQMVQEGFIKNIKDSESDIEIRQYITIHRSNEVFISIFKCYNDSCITELYRCYKNKNLVFDYYQDSIGISKSGEFFQRKIMTQPFTKNEKSIMLNLSKYGFFTMKDQTGFINMLKANQVELVSPCKSRTDCFETPILYEIKLNSKFRNFRMLGLDYLTPNISLRIKEFENNHYLKIALKCILEIDKF